MFKNFSPSLFFSMSAVTVLIFAPILMIFQPIFLMEFFPYDKTAATFIPNPVNLRLVLFACFVLMIMLGILAYRRNSKSYVIGILLFVISGGIAYSSTQNYLMITQDQIERRLFFQEHEYRWEQLDEIVYEYVVGNNKGEMTITTKTGEQFVIKEKEVSSMGRSQIYHFARANEVEYIEREKR